jgi:tetratricopeptide (TPR) repeat protein
VQEADALVGLSSTNARAGRLDEALAAGKRAVALYERAGTARQAVGPLINMAAALHNAQRNVEALPLAEQAVSLGRDSGEPIYLSAGLGQLAAVMHAIGDYDPEALEATYREAIKTLHEIGNARFELRVLLGYGAFLEETNRFAECAEVLTEAEQLGEKLAEPIHDKARDTLARARTVVTAASSAPPSAP